MCCYNYCCRISWIFTIITFGMTIADWIIFNDSQAEIHSAIYGIFTVEILKGIAICLTKKILECCINHYDDTNAFCACGWASIIFGVLDGFIVGLVYSFKKLLEDVFWVYDFKKSTQDIPDQIRPELLFDLAIVVCSILGGIIALLANFQSNGEFHYKKMEVRYQHA